MKIAQERKNMQRSLDIKEIQKLIPHQYPFLLVDKVLLFENHKYLRALKNVSINEAYFQGHFPDCPLMPGVLIIEALAQAAGILANLSGYMNTTEELYMFAGIEKARFKKPVVPGDTLFLEVNLLRKKARAAKFAVCALVENEIAAEATIIFIKKHMAEV